MTTLNASAPPATRITVDEFTARYANAQAELVEGIVKESPMPWPKHGKICATFTYLLMHHLEAHDLGHVMSNDSGVRTGPESVRGADVCYFSYERLPKGEVPEGLLTVAPDLVVEVRSPSDRWLEVFSKVPEYLRVGVRAVVVLDAVTAKAALYRDDEPPRLFHNSDSLTLPDVLPGFSVPVNRLFA